MIVTPLVSIIMPTYNRAGYILETIESIRNQTYANWELIIVDDGSDDNTEEIVAGLQDPRIKFYREQKTGNGSRLKNIGLKKASGNLYAFIDSDDIWAPEKLELQVNALLEHPEAGFCLTGGFNFYKAFEPFEYFYKEREGEKIGRLFESFFTSELPGFTQALLLRKECVKVTGFFREEKSFADLDFIVFLAYHFTGVIIFKPLFYRRLHSDNHSNSNWEKGYYNGIDIIQSYKKNKLVDNRLAKQSLFNLYINFGEDCLNHRQRKKAIHHFFNAWKNGPFSITPWRKTAKSLLHLFKNS